jgi:hypothetical protein
MSDLYGLLVEQVFESAQGEREPDMEHHREADDLGRLLNRVKGPGLDMPGRWPASCPASSRATLTEPEAEPAGPVGRGRH